MIFLKKKMLFKDKDNLQRDNNGYYLISQINVVTKFHVKQCFSTPNKDDTEIYIAIILHHTISIYISQEIFL